MKTPYALLRLLRPQQWVKNGFVIAPVFFSGNLFQVTSLVRALLAALAFSLVSSAIYILNDIRDREADRYHSQKKTRPLAAGDVSVPTAVGVLAALLILAGTLVQAARLGALFATIVGLYALINLFYNFGLKRVGLLEMFLVASGYVLRVIAGSAAIGITSSEWILYTTGTLALLMVVTKRRYDLMFEEGSSTHRVSLQSYSLEFLNTLMAILAAVTVITYFMFAISAYGESRFGTYPLLFTSFVVVFAVLRLVQICHSGRLTADPTVLVMRDPAILASLVAWGAVFFFVTYY